MTKMDTVKIYDNGGETMDRYTIITGDAVYGMSINPLSPQGFNQYIGEPREYRGCDLGEPVTLESLDEEVQKAIAQRVIK